MCPSFWSAGRTCSWLLVMVSTYSLLLLERREAVAQSVWFMSHISYFTWVKKTHCQWVFWFAQCAAKSDTSGHCLTEIVSSNSWTLNSCWQFCTSPSLPNHTSSRWGEEPPSCLIQESCITNRPLGNQYLCPRFVVSRCSRIWLVWCVMYCYGMLLHICTLDGAFHWTHCLLQQVVCHEYGESWIPLMDIGSGSFHIYLVWSLSCLSAVVC